MPKNDGGSAFPGSQPELQDGTWDQQWDPGMTMRQWYAGTVDIPWDVARALAVDRHSLSAPLLTDISKARAFLRFVEADAMLEAEKSDDS